MMHLTAGPLVGAPTLGREGGARRRDRKRLVGAAVALAALVSAGAIHAVNQSVAAAPVETAGPFSHFPH